MSRRIRTVHPVKRQNRIAVLRVERDLSQRDVARALGCPLSRIYTLEHDDQPPTSIERRRLSRLFGVADTDVFDAGWVTA